jgi:hypothetical protein
MIGFVYISGRAGMGCAVGRYAWIGGEDWLSETESGLLLTGKGQDGEKLA